MCIETHTVYTVVPRRLNWVSTRSLASRRPAANQLAISQEFKFARRWGRGHEPKVGHLEMMVRPKGKVGQCSLLGLPLCLYPMQLLTSNFGPTLRQLRRFLPSWFNVYFSFRFLSLDRFFRLHVSLSLVATFAQQLDVKIFRPTLPRILLLPLFLVFFAFFQVGYVLQQVERKSNASGIKDLYKKRGGGQQV